MIVKGRKQITFAMGTGEEGDAVEALLEKQKERLGIDSAAEVLRIALYTLAKVKDSQVVRYITVPAKKE